MKQDDPKAEKGEIVVVRRRAADDAAGGKGGAWKIAYADFVTAMMAFFLVMWLINASNEETRAQVASYFNPIKLTDTSTGARSLQDMKDTRNIQNSDEGEAGEGTPPSKQDVRSEAELMANPPKSLDRVAKTVAEAEFRNAGLESEVEIAPSLKPDTSNPGVGDPFDPRAWEAAKGAEPVTQDGLSSEEAETAPKPVAEEEVPENRTDAAEAPEPKRERHESVDKVTAEKARVKAEAAEIAAEIASRMGKAGEALGRSVDVVAIENGVLISLTEQENFEMFETGSAEPRPEAMKLMQTIANVVQTRQGGVVVRGHTDSRPYRNRYYDNWQLSTARAHFARYMLVRGGLEEKRIRKVEGVADREPRNRQDPQAAENRRIEILLTEDAP